MKCSKLIGTIFSLSYLLFVTNSEAASSLEWESKEITAECALGQELIDTVFRFKNTGTEPVIILEIKNSCGCTVSELDKQVYEPGESGKVTVSMKTRGFTGQQAKTVSIYTSESPDEPEVLFLFTNIPERFSVQPSILAWRFRGKIESKRATFRVNPDLEYDPALIKLVFTDRDGKGVVFETAVKKGAAPNEVALEVIPKHLRSMGHGYLAVYYGEGSEPEKVAEVYLVVN